MFEPVANPPDLVAQEHRILEFWRERRIFDKLRAQNAGGPRWSFLDGPITANNPMGVHHAWGRTYKDLFCRFHAMLGYDQRWQNGFDCQGLWVEVNVERELGFTSKRDIEAFGIAQFVNLCKQRVLTYAARQTEQSIRLGYWMDWNDPDELRRLRDLLAEDPGRVITVQGPQGPVTDTVEMIVGRLGMPELGGSYFTFSNENNDLIWAFLAECFRRGWLYKGHDTMPWCPRCGTGISQMEMNEGYQEREDPGVTLAFPLVDRPGESLLVWTTTPWTLAANVAAAVGEDLVYVKVRQGDHAYWLSKGTLRGALEGAYEVVEERPGRELVGWRYRGPFDHLPAVQAVFGAAANGPYQHRVVPWELVGEAEGTGIVHIAPGCGEEDYQLGKALGLPMVAPLDEFGVFGPGYGRLSGKDVAQVVEVVADELRRAGLLYRLAPYRHRYPHCWRCGTPLIFRLVDEWYISMGPVYDKPRSQLTREEIDRSLRYQIMEVVDTIRWIPSFGYERELDWLLNMKDWMISKKRYWGLALPIYECGACGTIEVIGGREELKARAVEGWDQFEGHTPHRPWVDAVKIACRRCGAKVSRIPDVGNPWLDAGIVPFSTLHYRRDPEYWARWFPADFVTESFPGQFRNWFYALLAMSTVLRRERPFKTLFGYATLLGEDGRPMHKSWGNAIEFDEAAERIGVDVMRWMFAKQRPEENILFGWRAADEARRELLVLWNVYAFFVSYARVAGWTPGAGAPPVAERRPLDRWILSRAAGTAALVEDRLRNFDAMRASQAIAAYVDDLSTWYLRLSRERMRSARGGGSLTDDERAAFATLHQALVAAVRLLAPILPFLAETIYQNLVAGEVEGAPESVHLTRWPTAELAPYRDEALEEAMALARRVVDLARTLRGQAGIKVRQPLRRLWVAFPVGREDQLAPLLDLVAAEVNVKEVEVVGDESGLVDRQVKPILPVVGPRYGPLVPQILAAARSGAFEILSDGSVRLAGVTLAPDEVEVSAVPKPGTAVAHDAGLAVIIDTHVTPELRHEGDLRELTRAIQDLRKEAGLALDERIVVTVDGIQDELRPRLAEIASEVLADAIVTGAAAEPLVRGQVELSHGPVTVALQRVGAAVLDPSPGDGGGG
jgi:isoleucyl-tRNA synthetase